MGALKHLRAIILLPGVVTLVIPGTILWREGTDSYGLWQSFPASRVILPIVGVICICLGLLLMTATIRLFVTVGKGTLAPWEPPQRLVVQGVYRHVRNPMISGVLSSCLESRCSRLPYRFSAGSSSSRSSTPSTSRSWKSLCSSIALAKTT